MQRVEFIGLPGVGKTTIQQKLVHALKMIDQEKYLTADEALLKAVSSNMNSLMRVALNTVSVSLATRLVSKMSETSRDLLDAQNRFLAERGEALGMFFTSSAYTNMSVSDREILLSAFLEIGAAYEIIKKRATGNLTVFFCEGFLQKSLMFLSQNDGNVSSMDTLNRYLGIVPEPDHVIYLKMNIMTCYERMSARPKGLTKRLKHVDQHIAIKFLEKCDAHFQAILIWIKSNTNVNIVEVENEGHIDTVVNELVNRFVV